MSLRKTPVVALLSLAAALSLTACGPDSKPSADHTTGPSAASSAPAKDCPQAQPHHKLVIVDSESAESGEIDYHEAKPVCSADGVTWQGTSAKGKSHMAHEDKNPKVKLYDNGGRLTDATPADAKSKLIECWHHPRTTPHGPCYANAYDVVDAGWDTGITELTQLPGK